MVHSELHVCRLVVLVAIAGLFAAIPLASPTFAEEAWAPAEARVVQNKLNAAIKAKDISSFRNAMEPVAALYKRGGADLLLTVKLDDLPDAEFLGELVEALAGLIGQGASAEVSTSFKAASEKGRDDWRRRVLIAQAFAKAGGNDAKDALLAAARDPHAKVRLATAVALGDTKLSDADVVVVGAALLESSEKAKDLGTPHRLARRALTRRTGFDHPDADAWKTFWAESGPTFSPEKRGEAKDIEMAQTGDPRYFSEPLTSRRLLFIIDTSKSMEGIDIDGWPDVPQDKKAIGGRNKADGFGWVLSPEQMKWFEGNPEARRLTRAKGELLRMLEKLPEHAQFNIVTFDTKLSAWNKALAPATAANVKSARKFVESLKADGHTRADLALAEIFRSNTDADTVYFLSDGTPSIDGKRHMETEPLVRMVKRANLFQQITIHTYDIGGDGQAFLESLAEATGGKYRKIVGPPQK